MIGQDVMTCHVSFSNTIVVMAKKLCDLKAKG